MRQSAIMTILMSWLAADVLARPLAAATDDAAVEWLSTEGVRKQLEQAVTVKWSGVPLRQAITNLSRSQRVAMLLDRRVDPDQEVDLSLEDVSLNAALQSIGLRLKLGVCRVGPVIYLGPNATAARLPTLVELASEQISKLPPAMRSPLLAPKRVAWEMLATPRALLAETARAYQVRIEPLSDVPHDLWAAADLPAIGFAERVSLIAAQFDLTLDITQGGRTIRLVAMPERPFIERSYSLAGASEIIGTLKQVLPRSELEMRDGKLLVRGPAEEHEIVATMLSNKAGRRTTVTPGKKVYQLDVAMPVRRLIKELGPKLDLDIDLDELAIENAGVSLDQDVKVTVKNVTEDQLLKAVLGPAGLTFKRDGKRIVVRPID